MNGSMTDAARNPTKLLVCLETLFLQVSYACTPRVRFDEVVSIANLIVLLVGQDPGVRVPCPFEYSMSW